MDMITLVTNLSIIAIVAMAVFSFNYIAFKALDNGHKK